MADAGGNLDLNSISQDLEEIQKAYDQYLKGREKALKEGSTAPPEITDYLTPEQLEAANLISGASVSVNYSHTEEWAAMAEGVYFVQALRRELDLANRTKSDYYAIAADTAPEDTEYAKKKVIEKQQVIKGRGAQ